LQYSKCQGLTETCRLRDRDSEITGWTF